MCDPRGVRRKIVKVEANARTFITLECGHRNEMASHFCYRVGELQFCFPCGEEQKLVDSIDGEGWRV